MGSMEDVWLNFAHTKYMRWAVLLYEGGLIIIIRFTFRDHVNIYLLVVVVHSVSFCTHTGAGRMSILSFIYCT